jgi:hypothetical protein
MGGSFEGIDLQFNLRDNAVAEDVEMTLRVLNEKGRVVAKVALRGKTRTVGQRAVRYSSLILEVASKPQHVLMPQTHVSSFDISMSSHRTCFQARFCPHYTSCQNCTKAGI